MCGALGVQVTRFIEDRHKRRVLLDDGGFTLLMSRCIRLLDHNRPHVASLMTRMSQARARRVLDRFQPCLVSDIGISRVGAAEFPVAGSKGLTLGLAKFCKSEFPSHKAERRIVDSA